MRRSGRAGAGVMGMALLLAAAPALADVKSGVDAWQKGDFKRAVEEWRPLAIAGDADAQFNMGQAYKLGRGVPLDPALAESWFLKAANQGHVEAGDNYGLALFEDGRKAEAAPWLEKSVQRGERRAQLVLGTMLFNGDGVTRDYPRAYALMTRASQQGLKSASDTLAQMDQYISPADRQQGVALAQRYAAQQQALQVAAAGDGRTEVPTVTRPAATPRPETPPLPLTGDDDRSPIVNLRSRPNPPAQSRQTQRAPVAPPPSFRTSAGQGWRVQLGAFRDAGNARALWSQVGGRVGGSPAYVNGGGVTRLQAGPFASKAAAEHACSVARVTCVVVAP